MELAALKKPLKLFTDAANDFAEDECTRHAAALAYYSLISFFPLLLVLISVIGFALSMGVPAAASARDQVISQVSAAIPTAVPLLEDSFEKTAQTSGITGLVGLLVGLWAASNIFAQLDKSFDVIFGVRNLKAPLSQKVMMRLRAILIVLLLALLMIISVVADAVINVAENLIVQFSGGVVAVEVINIGLSLLLSTLVFSALYRYLPNGKVTWSAALLGGLFTAITWAIGRGILAWYLSSREVPSAGAIVGAVLAFVALIYYFALILLFGGELSAVYQRRINAAELVPEVPEEVGPDVPPRSRSQPATFAVGLLAGIGLIVVGIPSLVWNLFRRRSD